MRGDYDALKMLIQNSKNINALDKNGMTALLYASRNGHTDIVRLLLEKNADVDLQCGYNKMTPLSYALKNAN